MLIVLAITIVMAEGGPFSFLKKKHRKKDAIERVDSTMKRDTLDSLRKDTGNIPLDSLHQAIAEYNKHMDDSIMADSIARTQHNALDAPVAYVAKDSIVFLRSTNRAYLFGSSNVKYTNLDLSAEKIDMSLDSSIVHATGAMDTVKKERFGLPIFLQGEDKYETDTMSFNFKSKRGLIKNAYTAQQDGYLLSERSKRDSTGNFYIRHGRYTTCDDPEPDFYLALSKAKVRPGKEVIFGSAHLVVQDVPLPLAVPFGFFPFSKKYTSGFIMPTYGDETDRGFYLRDGGYYLAISDKIDLKLLGEIFTKGSYGFSAASNYNIRYKFSGQFYISYQDSRYNDGNTQETSFKLQWTHRQDSKSSPYSTFSASVNYASTKYEQNNLTSLYNATIRSQSTRTSSISWGTSFSSIGLSLSSSMNVSQNTRDSSISMTLPDLNISVSRFYPFKRKHKVGDEKWYEKISMSYTGQITNSISCQEDYLFHSSLSKDWRNGWKHNIPVSGNFTLFKYLNVSPSFNFTDRMYLNKVMRSWDEKNQKEIADTVNGFYNVYNFSLSLGLNTKLYGFFVPNRKIFGEKIQAIRHTLTPSVSFSYAPDFSSSRFGFYETYVKTDAQGNVSTVEYSPYSNGCFGVPGKGMTGNVSMTIDNNIEMKIKSDKDSTGVRKISIIDQLSATLAYNFAAKEKPWSDLSMNIRLKPWKNYTFSMNAVFATYAYDLDKNGNPYVGNSTEWSRGRFGRFQGMSQNISYTINPEKIKKIFAFLSGKNSKDSDKDDNKNSDKDDDTGVESNIDPVMQAGQHGAEKQNAGMAETDEDGYLKFSIPWSLTFSYGITMRENTGGTFNKETMRYGYKFTQNLNFSGNIRISDGWNISFSSGYDFDYHKMSTTTASLARDLHCFNMSCSMVLMPYTSFNFCFRCNASTLTDALKYEKKSSYTNDVKWY